MVGSIRGGQCLLGRLEEYVFENISVILDLRTHVAYIRRHVHVAYYAHAHKDARTRAKHTTWHLFVLLYFRKKTAAELHSNSICIQLR